MTMVPFLALAANKHRLSPSLPSLLLLLLLSSYTVIVHSLTTPSSNAHHKTMINQLLTKSSLQNTYYALRHGQSLANVSKIISSDPLISTVQHGLSSVGKEQATLAGETFAQQYIDNSENKKYKGVAIFSSDFTRAKETAQLFSQQLHSHNIPLYTNTIHYKTTLRERYFGELNGGSDDQYQQVWDVDCRDADHTRWGVESANDVLGRTTGLICELDELLSSSSTSSTTATTTTSSSSEEEKEENEQKWKVVLVAHGDVLQILQTGFLKHEDASRHRSLDHLETATLRELMLV